MTFNLEGRRHPIWIEFVERVLIKDARVVVARTHELLWAWDLPKVELTVKHHFFLADYSSLKVDEIRAECWVLFEDWLLARSQVIDHLVECCAISVDEDAAFVFGQVVPA
jgi:hypothetical protein